MSEANQEKTKKRGKIKTLVIILTVMVILLAGGFIFYVHGISATDPANRENITITVGDGAGALQILEQLDEAGLVQNKLCAKIFVRLYSPKNIHANTYMLSKNMTLTEIFEAMETGNTKYISQSKFTVIEGSTIPQAAESIAAESGLSQKDILKKWSDKEYLNSLVGKYWFVTDEILNPDLKYPLEGYFYPETYFLPADNPDLEKLTEAMLNKMDKELTPLKDDIRNKLGMTVHQFLSFASVVEAESLFEEDRARIAGVFKNRLDQNMPLQSDITVLYALGEKRVNVSITETKVDSKYNTYKYPGLPVGPVCAATAGSMADCISYEPSDFLFFFATEDGKVLYSKTYAEHQKIVNENKWY